MRYFRIIFGLLLLGSVYGMQESFADKIPSPRQQLADGVTPEDIQCKENRVLVLRNNGSPACVTEKTANRTAWQKIEKPIEQIVKTESKQQIMHHSNNDTPDVLSQLNPNFSINNTESLPTPTNSTLPPFSLNTKSSSEILATNMSHQSLDGPFKIKHPDFISFSEKSGSKYHSLHVDKIMHRDEIRKYWLDEDDQKYWILRNDKVLIMTSEYASSVFTKTPMEQCKENLDLVIIPGGGWERWKEQHIRNHEIFIEKCRMESNQIVDKEKIESLSIYEKISRYMYIDIDPSEELWYLDSIIIDKLPIDSKNTLNAEVFNVVNGGTHSVNDILKSNSYEIVINDKLVKVVKYVKTMGNCNQEHIVLLEFTDEQETWFLNALYPTSCNMKPLNKVINDQVFTDIINSFEIYDYKYEWDVDLSDSPIIEPYDLLDDYGFSIQFDPEQWTLERKDGHRSRYDVSFFSWGADKELDAFPNINIHDDPKWNINKINPQKINSVDIPEIFWMTVQKIDISSKQWIDARQSVCKETNTKVPKHCSNVSFTSKSATINEKPVTITKYVETDRHHIENTYSQHHVFLIDLLDEQQTWIVHATYVYTPKEIIAKDTILESIINSFAVMGYEYDWYSVFYK